VLAQLLLRRSVRQVAHEQPPRLARVGRLLVRSGGHSRLGGLCLIRRLSLSLVIWLLASAVLLRILFDFLVAVEPGSLSAAQVVCVRQRNQLRVSFCARLRLLFLLRVVCVLRASAAGRGCACAQLLVLLVAVALAESLFAGLARGGGAAWGRGQLRGRGSQAERCVVSLNKKKDSVR
jgi:hypothetical protein